MELKAINVSPGPRMRPRQSARQNLPLVNSGIEGGFWLGSFFYTFAADRLPNPTLIIPEYSIFLLLADNFADFEPAAPNGTLFGGVQPILLNCQKR